MWGAAGDTGPGVPLEGAAFLPQKHTLHPWRLSPHASLQLGCEVLSRGGGTGAAPWPRGSDTCSHVTRGNRGSFQMRSPPSTEDPSPAPDGRCEDQMGDACGTPGTQEILDKHRPPS